MIALAAGCLVLLAAGVVLLLAGGEEARQHEVVEVVIPTGTAERVRRGERVPGIPRTIVARAGDTLRLVNRDRSSHQVGPFLVGPGETITSALARPGKYVGDCTIHPGREIAIVVRA